MQNSLLSAVENVISNKNKELLIQNTKEKEIRKANKSMHKSKTTGIDGYQ